MDTNQRDCFIAEYLSMWHEPDAVRRRATVQKLWAPDAENITRTFTVRGLEQIMSRVDEAHTEWVAKRDFIFRPSNNTDGHNHLIKFHWEMLPRLPRDGNKLEARGLDIFVLDDEKRIRTLYQFSEPLPVK